MRSILHISTPVRTHPSPSKELRPADMLPAHSACSAVDGPSMAGNQATGTELTAELHRTARDVVAYGLDRIDPERDIRIVLIEAGDRVLPGLPDRSLGQVEVPATALWDAQTQRSLQHFSIGQDSDFPAR